MAAFLVDRANVQPDTVQIAPFPYLESGEAEATGDEEAMTREDVRRLSAALSVSLMGGALIIAVVAGAYFWVKFLVNHL